MSTRWLTVRLGCAAALVLGTLSCDAEVRIPDDDDGGGSTSAAGGESSSTSSAGGAPTTGAGGSGGSGGSEPDAEALVKAQCPEVGAESHFCVTVSYPGTLYAVGPDTGNICYLGTIGGLEGEGVSSIAVVGPNVHGCSHNVGVWRAPVLGGAAEILPIDCGALTGYQGGFLLGGEPYANLIRHYADFESVGSDSELQSFDIEPKTSMTARQGTLFTAGFSTGQLNVYDLPSSTELPDLELEDFAQEIDGISVTSDGRLYVLSNGASIFAFDATTGEQLQQKSNVPTPDSLLTTLHCWTN